jgi:hypothetical protein
MDDSFETSIPQKALGPLLQLGSELGFDPTSSEEAETFFTSMVAQFSGPDDSLEGWLREQLGSCFKSLGRKPRWIQNPNWQFTDHGPMLFVGQLDIPPGLFHDDASFYTFFEVKTGILRTIVQVA